MYIILVRINAVLLNIFLINESKKKVSLVPKKILSNTTVSTLIINQHIRMISEESCDTEDWSNDAENAALITGITYVLKYIKIEKLLF